MKKAGVGFLLFVMYFILFCGVLLGLGANTDIQIRVLIYRGKEAKIFLKGGVGWVRISASEVNGKREYSSSTGIVYLENNPYRGNFTVYKCGEDVCVVNKVGIEDYVKGVLFNEISHYWPMEAIKAQAIVARSYALYQYFHPANENWHLSATQYHQVYRGMNSERYRLDVAVDETRGMILTCGGKILKAFYSSCCGGITALPQDIWQQPAGKYDCYKVVVDHWCEVSPYRNWIYCLDKRKFLDMFVNGGYVRGKRIYDIRVVRRDKTGRVIDILIVTELGKFYITGHRFRMLLGPSRVKSLLFDMVVDGNKVYFLGAGWGHGVGLCQWGAYGMAKAGYSYRQILKFYYPNSNIVQYKELLRNW